jgi:hypothetical protein
LTESIKKPVKKGRSEEEKYGKYKWLRVLVRRNAEDLREIKRMLRGLRYEFRHQNYGSAYLLELVCKDSRDQAILDVLREAGPRGILPKDIHAKVAKFGLQYHHVTRRVNRMNKRLKDEIEERVADKIGSKWALSDFMRQNWDAQKDEEADSGESEKAMTESKENGGD